MEYRESIWNEVERMYLDLKSIRKIERELKIGSTSIKKFLVEKDLFDIKYGRSPSRKDSVAIGQKFGRWMVIDPLVQDGVRYMVDVICECGTRQLIRSSNLIKGRTMGCRSCSNKTNYPTFRKSRCNPDESLMGLSPTWLSGIIHNKERGLYRTLDVEIDSHDLLNQLKFQNFKCAYTGENLNVLGLNKSKSNASVDRINGDRGYSKENIQWVSKNVNRMKNSFTEKEFLDTCFKIYEFKHGNPEPSSLNIN